MTGDPGEVGSHDVLPWRLRTRRPTAQFRSPAVRHVAATHGVDVAGVAGTGRGGRVTREDVLLVARSSVLAPETRAEPTRGTTVPLSTMRRTIAAHMVRAQVDAAPAHVVMECDCSHVEVVRRRAGLTALPFVARAVVDALAEYPLCNAIVSDDHLVVSDSVHLGIAIDLDFDGLVVPVVHHADRLRLRALAAEIVELAARARARRLVSDDVAGATFTITNPGGFGTFASAPILAHPEVAILATDAVQRQVAVDPEQPESLAVRWMGMLSLAFDHRAIDGAYAAAFLGRVRSIIEGRDWRGEL